MTDENADAISEAIKEAGVEIAYSIKEAFGRDMGRDIGFVGEIALALQSIGSAMRRIADHLEGKT